MSDLETAAATILVAQATKQCTLCLEVKPLDEFYLITRAGGKRRGRCKDCLAKTQPVRKPRPPKARYCPGCDAELLPNKRYCEICRLERNHENRNEASKRWRERNPEKWAAIQQKKKGKPQAA